MLCDAVLTMTWVWTTSGQFVSRAAPVETVATFEVSDEILVTENSKIEENIKNIAGIVGRKHKI